MTNTTWLDAVRPNNRGNVFFLGTTNKPIQVGRNEDVFISLAKFKHDSQSGKVNLQTASNLYGLILSAVEVKNTQEKAK